MPLLNYFQRAKGFAVLSVAIIGVCGLPLVAAKAQDQIAAIDAANTYLVPVDEGYGVADCLSSGGECAHIMANAWCESHGFAKARAFGRADDVTATINPQSKINQTPNEGYIVVCGD